MLVPLNATSPPPARADVIATPGPLISAFVFEKARAQAVRALLERRHRHHARRGGRNGDRDLVVALTLRRSRSGGAHHTAPPSNGTARLRHAHDLVEHPQVRA